MTSCISSAESERLFSNNVIVDEEYRQNMTCENFEKIMIVTQYLKEHYKIVIIWYKILDFQFLFG